MKKTGVYVKAYKNSQELVTDHISELKGKLILDIETIGFDTDQQEKIKKHILSEVQKICSEISKDQVNF